MGKVFAGIGVSLTGFVMVLALILAALATIASTPTESYAEDSPQTVCDPDTGESGTVKIPEEYQTLVAGAAEESGFSPTLIGAQIEQESNWDPKAESPAGAQGIAQFMPGTWAAFGEGGDPFKPDDAIPALGRYMLYLRQFMEDHADDEEELVGLVLAGYNAGEGRVQEHDFDLDSITSSIEETRLYIEIITTAADGDYTSDCESDNGGGGDGSIVDTAGTFAWDDKVVLPRSTAYGYGKAESKPEFVAASTDINNDLHTAYFTDCGVYVATVMIASGADEDFPVRGTTAQLAYLQGSDKYETFNPSSEGDLEPGDILIVPGHIYIYTGERNSSETGRAQGASLYTRVPSGHNFFLSDNRGSYTAARLTE